MASNGKRLGLSVADFGLLIGAAGPSTDAWEAGMSKPRVEALKAIASLRHIGRREVAGRLSQLVRSKSRNGGAIHAFEPKARRRPGVSATR